MARGLRRVFLKAFSAGLAANAALTRSRFRVLEPRVLTPAFVALTKGGGSLIHISQPPSPY